jgi:hypothetical protein
MLRHTYTKAKDRHDHKWQILEEFFGTVRAKDSAFLCMNWDTVIDEGMYAQRVKNIDYSCNAKFIRFNDDDEIELAEPNSGVPVQIVKVHGSANWLYCDSCRDVFWVEPRSTLRVADQLFRPRDWEVVEKHIGETYRKAPHWRAQRCPSCDAAALGTRIATFSYRKALDFPMYEQSWLSAEQLLKSAVTWTFIGYSLPAADYEFKHLLKRVQLSRRSAPKLFLITGGTADAVAITRRNYQKFFGPQLGRSSGAFFGNGLTEKVIRNFEREGILTPATKSRRN